MLVKACGLRNIEEMNWAYDLGYDLFGLVVDPKSKRYLSMMELAKLWQSISRSWRGRCVLVARKWQHLALCARICPEALLQCYEPYPVFIHSWRRLMPIKSEEQWQLSYTRQSAAYYLYDTSFGSGEWHGLPNWCIDKKQLFVAGGLNENRLQQLAASQNNLHYFGFDLSSGLEEADDEAGYSRKNYAKMEKCLNIIRTHF